ncbi:MAG: Maf family protein [bacterium]
MKRIVLASASPRRLQLVAEAGWSVEVEVSAAEEIEDHSLPPEVLALENAKRKWRVIAERRPEDLIVAADTVVWFGGRFFGKPANIDEARVMLGSLVGRTHEVVTGVVVGNHSNCREFAEHSLVTFHDLNRQGVEDYISSINPLDKAGGYAAQDDGGRLIANIEGSLSNVIGLPMERLSEVLREFQRLQE